MICVLEAHDCLTNGSAAAPQGQVLSATWFFAGGIDGAVLPPGTRGELVESLGLDYFRVRLAGVEFIAHRREIERVDQPTLPGGSRT